MTEPTNGDTTNELFLIADELRAIANYGLRHYENEYEKERLLAVLNASAKMAGILENRSGDEILTEYEKNMDHISPFLGAEAAVFRDNNILLIKRHDDKLWAIPGGKIDIGETSREAAVRELEEETGLTGTATKLLGIFDSRLWNTRRKEHIFHIIFEVDSQNGLPNITHEALDCGFFGEDELPPLSHGHDARIPFLFKLHRGEITIPFFD